MTESIAAQRESTLERLFHGYEGPPFAIRLWDGWQWNSPGHASPRCTLVFHSEDALHALMAHPNEVTLGERFLNKEIDVEGDLFAVFDMAEYVFHQPRTSGQRLLEASAALLAEVKEWWNKGSAHTPERDGSAISYHYDQPAEFYRAWLGETMVYSCAYFKSKSDTLDTAQTNKLEMICRKLRLQPGEMFMDIGCGWGSLVMHAASQHQVFAQGITLSQVQARVAEHRLETAHLTQSSGVALLDYRLAPKQFHGLDKIASVGMFEHVGLCNLRQYFRTVYNLLKPGGVFLNHGIARAWKAEEDEHSLSEHLAPSLHAAHPSKPKNVSFMDKYVFPDGELVTLAQAVQAAESAGFEVRDVENLREHYELTLRRWTEALQDHTHEVLQYVSERVYRIWLLYMAGCAAAFRRGDIALYQMLLSRPDHGRTSLPLTRDDLYRDSKACERRAA